MRKSLFFFVMLILGILAHPIYAQTVHGKASCSNRTGMGTYGYNCGGVAPNPFKAGNPVEPFAGYGVVTADGKGHWNGYGKVSFNGKVVKWTHDTRVDDPSTVNRDCTGNVTYAVTITADGATFPVDDAHFEFVIVDDGREIKGFPMDPGYAVSCQLILTHDKSAGTH